MIYISSGWIFGIAENKKERINLHEKLNKISDGLELHVTKDNRLKFYENNDINIKDATLHLPTYKIDINKLIKKYNPEYGVIHPKRENIDYKNIDILIENMDKDKTYGKEIEEIRNLLQDKSGLCVDIQHCYEKDPTMEYTKELKKKFNNQIRQVHVSGETENLRHSLVHKSNNKEKIREGIQMLSPKKIIIEGKYENMEDIRKEIDYINTIL
jgi:hypothetical protein